MANLSMDLDVRDFRTRSAEQISKMVQDEMAARAVDLGPELHFSVPQHFAAIELAATRIRERNVPITPVLSHQSLNQSVGARGCQLFFKCENLHTIGAFKIRGALNCLTQLTPEERARGVITHSSGNHAQALAYGSQLLGIKGCVVMPETAPVCKVEATRSYGVEIVRSRADAADRERVCNQLISEHGYYMVHPYDNWRIIHGAGTAALELLTSHPDIDIIAAPVGGGGLLSGTALAARGLRSSSIRVLGCEPTNADDAALSFATQTRQPPRFPPNSVADGLLTGLGERNFEIIRRHVDEIVTVTDAEIVSAMKLLMKFLHVVVEPSGAVPFAAILKLGRTNPQAVENRRVGLIISGGNVDLENSFGEIEKKVKEPSPHPLLSRLQASSEPQ
eukprot:gnl/Spiro4/29312_TR14340_c0_g1_i1.p1 gnl/Spiro4/29312_TR14340_c0_g1~~gnl/Spiro4/29312_TR14340_c0_g1_i1.p1  ORF type:complete len:392 (+),score=46.87 gnl/Spiro4/29312_TR14340_c0_g1_i1:60-1235(+)